jgi:hypothetical protein
MEEQRTDTILNSLAEGVITVDEKYKISRSKFKKF